MTLWKLDNSIHIGEFIKPHSYLGKIRVAFFMPGLDEILLEDSFLFAELNGKPVPYKIEFIQWTSADNAILKLYGVDDEKSAMYFKGKNICYNGAQLPEVNDDEDNLMLIAGYEILDENKNSIGRVTDVLDSGAQQILVIENNCREVLIPFHEDFIIRINKRSKQLFMSLPDGLTELNT